MEWGEIIGYAASALGGGGIASVINWRTAKRKATEEVKSDEIENIRKSVEVYQTIINDQNKRIAELNEEVQKLRDERREMEKSYQAQIASLQRQIVEITRALGIRSKEHIKEAKESKETKRVRNGND